MKKSSTYAHKRRGSIGLFNGAEYLNAISRCRPYSDEVLPGATTGETTQAAAEKSLKLVDMAYRSLKAGKTHANDADDFNRLAHALGISEIRAEQIAGLDHAQNAMLPILAAGNAVLDKIKARRIKWGKWEVLPTEAETIFDALEVYETILLASSPAQMSDAVDKRTAWLRLKDADRLAAVG